MAVVKIEYARVEVLIPEVTMVMSVGYAWDVPDEHRGDPQAALQCMDSDMSSALGLASGTHWEPFGEGQHVARYVNVHSARGIETWVVPVGDGYLMNDRGDTIDRLGRTRHPVINQLEDAGVDHVEASTS